MCSFRVIFRPEPEGGYTVMVPSLPGCVTYGETLIEAEHMAKDAIEGCISILQEEGEEIIDDSQIYERQLFITA